MNARAGYKVTEIGVIPYDWHVSRLADVGSIIRGASPRPKGDKRYYGGPVPRLMVEDVTRDGKYVTPSVDSLTYAGAAKSRPCRAGTLTIVCSGTVGVVSFLAVDACIHDGFLALVNLRQEYSSDYLYHQLSDLRGQFDNSATHGGVFTNLTTSGVKDFLVAFPSEKHEQLAIAQALSDMDDAIAAQEAVIAKKRALRAATMQALLSGTRRLPGFSGEWESIQLGTIAHIKTGSRNNEDKRPDGKYPLFVRSQTVERIDSYSYDEEAILVPGEGGVGNIFHYVNGKFDCHQRVYKISKFDDSMSGRFVYFSMIHSFGAHAMQNTVKATVDSLRLPTFKGFTFLAPARAEQDAIAATLLDIETELAEQEEMLTKLCRLKVGMMQQLLTGKIRLV